MGVVTRKSGIEEDVVPRIRADPYSNNPSVHTDSWNTDVADMNGRGIHMASRSPVMQERYVGVRECRSMSFLRKQESV